MGPVPGAYKIRTEMRFSGGSIVRFIASTQEGECEYNDFILFAMDLLQNKGSTLDLWDIDEGEGGESPTIFEYCPVDQVLYITFRGRDPRLVIYPLPEREKMVLVRALRIVALKCLEFEGLSPQHILF
jgi:hypothetical protein